ncbi:hypothetical protein ACO7_320001 [Thiomonas arsenitoxydans]|nr:hypothetical protein ACO7_320001 [Thiomonas arsenitoxydans]CQR32769.1 hypothetical protein ACO3_340001 [Thiomonas arsenitoxydans]CQR40513.1 hypothetical protein THICB6_80364 [Thiomonas arsenitoxydans]
MLQPNEGRLAKAGASKPHLLDASGQWHFHRGKGQPMGFVQRYPGPIPKGNQSVRHLWLLRRKLVAFRDVCRQN